MKCIIIVVVILFKIHIIHSKEAIYNLMAVNKTLSSPSYKTLTRERMNCFGVCNYEERCKSFDQSKRVNSRVTCNFYPISFQYTLYMNETLKYMPGVKYYSIDLPALLGSRPSDCVDWYEVGARESKVYIIYIVGKQQTHKKEVFCDMEIDGGGWIVNQKRFNGKINFQRNWDDYKHGFGNTSGEHWLGNKYLNLLTTYKEHVLYVQGTSFANEIQGCKYSKFAIANESNIYRLSYYDVVAGCQNPPFKKTGYGKINMPFSTFDRDNDGNDDDDENCASLYKGGWWYNDCFLSSFNGPFPNKESNSLGMLWHSWKSLKGSLLIIKRRK